MPKILIEVTQEHYKLLKDMAKENESSAAGMCRKIIKNYISDIKNKKFTRDVNAIEPIRSGTPVNTGRFRNEFEDTSEEDDDNYPPETDGKLYNEDGTIKRK